MSTFRKVCNRLQRVQGQLFAERTTDAVQAITGQAPRRFEAYSQEHRHHWLA